MCVGTCAVMRSGPLFIYIILLSKSPPPLPQAVPQEVTCSLPVSTGCYGVAADDIAEEWSCDRCTEGSFTAVGDQSDHDTVMEEWMYIQYV